MEFLSNNLVLILCGLAGFGMLLAEAFMPGFGVAGILGIILEVIAIWSAWVHHGTLFALILTVVIIVLIAVTVFLSYRSAMKGRLSKSPLVLKDEEAPAAESGEALRDLINREGIAVTPLRPGGNIEIDGKNVKAASTGELIPKGTRVSVTDAAGDHVVVRPV